MDAEYNLLMEQLFSVLDSDKTNQICWSEFVKFQAEARDVLHAQWRMDAATLRREFDAFDADGNGVISRQEFMQMMEKLCSKGSPAGLRTLKGIVEAVIARHGRGAAARAPRAGTARAAEESESERRRALFIRTMVRNFEKADADGNGVVTFSEFLRHEFETNGESNIQKLRMGFKRIDLNGDGLLSRDEITTLASNIFDESMANK